MKRLFSFSFGLVAMFAVSVAAPAKADSVRAVDPNDALNAGSTINTSAVPADTSMPDATTGPMDVATSDSGATSGNATLSSTGPVGAKPYRKDDLIGAAEGVFGKGAKGLAEIIEKILKDQGEPNAYIAGREASGAVVVGLRYGSGTLSHNVEGQRPVYWTGPSLGFDLGGDATKTFVLVYNLYDSQDLYRRYPQVEGRAYFVGGFSATYLRRGNVALIPVRLGVGVRLGANIGYMKFSEKSKWLPF